MITLETLRRVCSEGRSLSRLRSWLGMALLFIAVGATATTPPKAFPVAEAELCERLMRTLSSCEVVVVGLEGQVGFGSSSLKITVAEFEERGSTNGATPRELWSSRVCSPFRGQVIAYLLSSHADGLKGVRFSGLEKDGPAGLGALVFRNPRDRVLELGPARLRLSPQTQNFLALDGESQYACTRRVLIVEDPHANAQDQYAVMKGLECLLSDNPSIAGDGQVVSLAEGCRAYTVLSCRPLIEADKHPSDSLISGVLGTYLIPGYVAFEWKHQYGIPIVGTEDPVLYEISARVWTQLRIDSLPVHRGIWPQTVAARNSSMALVILNQLNLRACPILFVGGMHMATLPPFASLDDAAWHEAARILSPGELGRMRSAKTLGIADLLRERRVGLYLLSAQTDVSSGQESDGDWHRYESLFRAQLSRNLDAFLANLRKNGVTVAPCPEAAAQILPVIKASMAGDNAKRRDGQEDQNKESKGKGKGGKPGKQGLLDKLRDGLKKLLGGGGPPSDPSKPPGPGWEWRGDGKPGSGDGAWYNKETGESLRPYFGEADHADHYDYTFKQNSGKGWRIYLDRKVEPK